MDRFMDGKYNKVLDSLAVRASLLALAFVGWVVVGVGLLTYGA